MRISLKLHPDWRKILRNAWSIRLDVALIVLETAQAGIDAVSGNPPIDPTKFAMIAMGVSAASFVARFVKQESVSGADQ